jgi:tripartite-type tricarboxylate transporter receptor subunit TctC
VAILGKTPYVMVTAANGPYKNLKALLEAARAKPGELPFASAGVGTSTHLSAEYVVALAKLKMIHIPFKGSPDAMQDVLGGRSSFYMAPINAGMSLVKDGKLTALGVSTRTRAEVLPNVPTLDEQGLFGYDMTLWFGMWAPAGTPDAVVKKAQRVGERDRAGAEREGAVREARHPARADETGRIREVRAQRDRGVPQGRARGEHRAAVNAQ